MLQILRIRTIIYCLRSFRYYNPYAWNDLSDDIKKSDTIAGNFETRYHKRKIIDYITKNTPYSQMADTREKTGA